MKADCRFQTKYTVPIFNMKRCTYTCIFLTIGIYTAILLHVYCHTCIYVYVLCIYISKRRTLYSVHIHKTTVLFNDRTFYQIQYTLKH